MLVTLEAMAQFVDLFLEGSQILDQRSSDGAGYSGFQLEVSDLVGVGAWAELATLPFDVLSTTLEVWRSRVARESLTTEDYLSELDTIARQLNYRDPIDLDAEPWSASRFGAALRTREAGRHVLEAELSPNGEDVLIAMRAVRRRRGERGARENRLIADGIVESLAALEAERIPIEHGRVLFTALWLAAHLDCNAREATSDRVDDWIEEWFRHDSDNCDQILRRLALAEGASQGQAAIAVDLLVVEPEGWLPIPPADPAADALLRRVQLWCDADQYEPSVALLQDLVGRAKRINDEHSADALQQLRTLFSTDLRYDTGGVRATMQPGPGGVNDLTVRALAKALAEDVLAYVAQTHNISPNNQVRDAQVVVCFDGRRNSERFALMVAEELLRHDVTAVCFDAPLPTPIWSYIVGSTQAVAGVMITASHNRASDNGIKVCDERGAQRIDGQSMVERAQQLLFLTEFYEVPPTTVVPRATTARVVDDYVKHVIANVPKSLETLAGLQSLTIGYTPLHGVAGEAFLKLLAAVDKFDLHIVTSQFETDSLFPTVDIPNPEVAQTMREVVALGVAQNCDVVLAHDPDGDRLGVGVRAGNKADGSAAFKLLSGDEIGALLVDYLLGASNGSEKSRFVCATMTASGLVRKIVEKHGASFIETESGFRWIAHAIANKLETDHNSQFVFGYEAALGFEVLVTPREKDGLSSALALLLAITELKQSGRSPLDRLRELTGEFGLHVSEQSTREISDAAEMTHARAVLCGPVDVAQWRSAGETCGLAGAHFENRGASAVGVLGVAGERALLRASGTELKIKCGVEVVRPTVSASNTGGDRDGAEMASAKAFDFAQRVFDTFDVVRGPV